MSFPIKSYASSPVPQEETKALLALYNKLPGAPRLPEEMIDLEKVSRARVWIDAHGDTLSRIKSLDLSNRELVCLPKELDKLPNLKDLNLENNRLSSLPSLSNRITWLNLSGNKFSSIPQLPDGLEKLYVKGNLITEPPKNIPKGLAIFGLADQFDAQKSFTLCSFSGEILLRISRQAPYALFRLNKLLHGIHLDPDNQEHLLQKLEVTKRFWPPFAPTLPPLQKNRAILNELVRLCAPMTLNQITGKEVFAGSTEEIAAIDAGIQRLEEDRATLALYRRIDDTPALNGAASIAAQAEQARAWMNDNEEILEDVENLDLSGANLYVIPREIPKLSGLGLLDLSNNKISSLVGFQCNEILSELHLENNRISSVHGFQLNEELEMLYLDHNQISSLQGMQFNEALGILSLKNNPIASPEDIHFNEELTTLFLDANQATSLITTPLEKALMLKESSVHNGEISPLLYQILQKTIASLGKIMAKLTL